MKINFELKAVIFDMDGTMIDSEPISKEGWRKGLDQYGLEMTDEFFYSLIGRGYDTAKQSFFNYYGNQFDYDGVKKARAEYIEDYVSRCGFPLKKGLIQLLDKLDSFGIKKCVATSTAKKEMEHRLGALGLLNRFDAFVAGDQVKLGKPNPEIFLTAASKVGVKPDNCIVLEDSLLGVAAGCSAGMHTIMVPDLVQPDEDTLGRIFMKCDDLLEVAEFLDLNIKR